MRADGYDEAADRYRGLRCGQRIDVFHDTGEGLLVRSDIALKQQEADAAHAKPATTSGAVTGGANGASGTIEPAAPSAGSVGSPATPSKSQRYFGTVTLDASRVGRDAGRIADEVIAHLSGLVGSEVTVTLEIEATVPGGVPDNVVRTVTENSRTLKFKNHGFENE
jgi:hypothetical protein